MISRFDRVSPLDTLLTATEQMRSLHPTARESAAWDRERASLVAATVAGAVASLVAFPDAAPVVIPAYQPPVIPEPPRREVHDVAA